MEGALAPLPARDAVAAPAHEARVVLRTADWAAVGFALGIIEVLPRDDEDDRRRPPRPRPARPRLGRGRGAPPAARRPRRGRSGRRCSTSATSPASATCTGRALLPRRRAPRAPVGDVPDLRRLVRRAKPVLEANKERVEQTTTGDLRRGRQHWVYRRERQPCRRCGTHDPDGRSRDHRCRSGRRTGARPASRSPESTLRRRRRPTSPDRGPLGAAASVGRRCEACGVDGDRLELQRERGLLESHRVGDLGEDLRQRARRGRRRSRRAARRTPPSGRARPRRCSRGSPGVTRTPDAACGPAASAASGAPHRAVGGRAP